MKLFRSGFLQGATTGLFVSGLLGFIFFAGIVHRHLAPLVFFGVAMIVGAILTYKLHKDQTQ